MLANPIRLSETPVQYRRVPPALGEHTDQLLQSWLGRSTEAIAALRAAGALG